jgi:hypothetical protein
LNVRSEKGKTVGMEKGKEGKRSGGKEEWKGIGGTVEVGSGVREVGEWQGEREGERVKGKSGRGVEKRGEGEGTDGGKNRKGKRGEGTMGVVNGRGERAGGRGERRGRGQKQRGGSGSGKWKRVKERRGEMKDGKEGEEGGGTWVFIAIPTGRYIIGSALGGPSYRAT